MDGVFTSTSSEPGSMCRMCSMPQSLIFSACLHVYVW